MILTRAIPMIWCYSMKRVLIPLLLTVLLATSLAGQTVSLSPERVVVTPFSRPTRTDGSGHAPAFAAAGRDGHYLMAWSEYDTTNTRASLHTAAIDSNGTIIEGSRYVAPALRQFDPNAQYPAVAFDGERFLVAWIEGSYNVQRLLAMRFDRDGKPLEPVPQLISLDARYVPVAVAAGGGEFTIAYGVGTVSAISRVRADGTVLERDRTVGGTGGFWRDIESNGTAGFLVSELSGTVGCMIGFCSPATFRTFSRVGPATTATTILVTQQFQYLAPVGSGVATDGQRFLAATWSPNTTPGQSGSLIRGFLTDPTGSSFIREFLIAKYPSAAGLGIPGGRIDAVWTGGSYAIAYERRPSNLHVDINLSFVSQIGMALTDPVELASSYLPERSPVILPLSETRVLVLYERGEYARPEIVARQVTLSLRTRAVR